MTWSVFELKCTSSTWMTITKERKEKCISLLDCRLKLFDVNRSGLLSILRGTDWWLSAKKESTRCVLGTSLIVNLLLVNNILNIRDSCDRKILILRLTDFRKEAIVLLTITYFLIRYLIPCPNITLFSFGEIVKGVVSFICFSVVYLIEALSLITMIVPAILRNASCVNGRSGSVEHL